jgi:hypothetical protein
VAGSLNMTLNLRLPQKAGYSLTSWATVSFSRRNILHGISYEAVLAETAQYVWLLFTGETSYIYSRGSKFKFKMKGSAVLERPMK